MCKSLVAVWDTHTADNRLGSFFIFLQEINIHPALDKTVILVGSHKWLGLFESLLLKFLNSDIRILVNRDDFKSNWPSNEIAFNDCSYKGSMRAFNKLLMGKKLNAVPVNSAVPSFKLNGAINCAVHLKHNPTDSKSNAHFENWCAFFNRMLVKQKSVKFHLVGDDYFPEKLIKMPNVVKLSGSVIDYFLTVTTADAFIGMSSAFSVAAILGNKPYRIWKHPGHHEQEMKLELDCEGQFPFRCFNQRLLIELDSAESLISEVNFMLDNLKS